jgi:hypothetical protein
VEVLWGIILWHLSNDSSNKWMEWEIKKYSFLDDVAIDSKFMLEVSRKGTHSCANCWGVGIGRGFLLLKVFLLSLMARISS